MHRFRSLAALTAAAAGFGLAALLGVAAAKSFTLKVAKHATVKPQSGPTKTESIAVNSRGHAVYTLSGDSMSHPKCTSSTCEAVWPPLKISAPSGLSKQSGIKGKLGAWHHNGFFQATLNGRPLYTFGPDQKANTATGEGIMSFGGTWHVVKASGGGDGGAGSGGGGSTGTTATTNPYPSYPTYP